MLYGSQKWGGLAHAIRNTPESKVRFDGNFHGKKIGGPAGGGGKPKTADMRIQPVGGIKSVG